MHQPLHLPRLVRRRSNTVSLDEKLRLLLAVVQTQPTIHQLLAAGDFPGALELIASSQSLLAPRGCEEGASPLLFHGVSEPCVVDRRRSCPE